VAAHDQLESTDPAADSTVESLESITLSYSGTLLSIGEDQRSAAIQVVQGDRYYELECPTLVDNTASVPVALGSAGDYEVRWQVVSSDGHTISGDYAFTYEPADGAAAAEGSTTPMCGDASADDGGPSDDAILIGAAGGIGGLAVIGVAIAVIVGRLRRGRDDFPTPPADRP
jgi:copper resistance protein C